MLFQTPKGLKQTKVVKQTSFLKTMESKATFSRIFKGISAVALLCLFMYWGYVAICKYIEQPISTQISYRFGDEDDGLIEFPAVTFCPLKHMSLANKFNCPMDSNDYMGTGRYGFSDLLFICYMVKKDFHFTDIYQHMNIKREDYVRLYPMKSFLLDTENLNVSLGWKTVFSMYFGTCFIFDPKQVPGYEKQNVSHIAGNPKMQFELLNKNVNYKVILHSGYDFWDGKDLYPTFETSGNESLVGNLKKKIIKRVKSTKHFCQDKAMQTCSYEHLYEDVRNEFICEFLFARASFLGLSDEIGLCNGTVHKEIISRMRENLDYKGIYQKCTSKMACTQPTYTMEMTNGVEVENPLIELVFASPIVEYNIDSISYDLQSLIGEIGGTLGLTLGLSFYSLLDLVEYLEQKFMK